MTKERCQLKKLEAKIIELEVSQAKLDVMVNNTKSNWTVLTNS